MKVFFVYGGYDIQLWQVQCSCSTLNSLQRIAAQTACVHLHYMSMITYIYTIYNIETICRDIHIFCLPVDSWWNCLNFFFNILVHLTHCKVTRVCVCVFVYSNNTPYNICVLDLCKIFRNIILCTQVVTNKTSNVSHCQNYLTALRNKIQKTKKKNHLLYTWLLFCPELGLIYLNWSKCLFTLFCDAVMHEL